MRHDRSDDSARESNRTSEESVILIRRAREGDRDAWDTLCSRYYPQWLKRWHGVLGGDLKRAVDTQDLIQSAVSEALKGIDKLRSEGAFFSWVSVIIRHKLASRRRGHKAAVELDAIGEPQGEDARVDRHFATEEEYVRVLDAMIKLHENYPEAVATVYLKYFERMSIAEIVEVLGASERTVHRWQAQGMGLLRSVDGI